MSIKIDKNITIPPKGKYPFGEMEVGDSFDIGVVPAGNVRSAASIFAKRNSDYAFTVRRNGKGYRCWRIEPKSK